MCNHLPALDSKNVKNTLTIIKSLSKQKYEKKIEG